MNGVWVLVVLSTYGQLNINISRFWTIEGCQQAGQAVVTMLDRQQPTSPAYNGRTVTFRCVLDKDIAQ